MVNIQIMPTRMNFRVGFLCHENPARGSKEAIAGEKIKNKGIRRNEMCACRDRRPRRSK